MLLATLVAFGGMRVATLLLRAPSALEVLLVAPLGAVLFVGAIRVLRVIHPEERTRLARLLPGGGIRRVLLAALGGADQSLAE